MKLHPAYTYTATVHYLFVKQVAEILRVSPEHIRRQIRAGEIPFIRIGKVYKIPVTYLGWQPPEEVAYVIRSTSTQLELW